MEKEGVNYVLQASLRRLGLLLEKPELTIEEQYEVVFLEEAVERMRGMMHVTTVAIDRSSNRVIIVMDGDE